MMTADTNGEATPTATRRTFYRTTLFQMLVVGLISFLAPGLWNGAQGLGAGGALEPYLVSLSNSLVFVLMGFGCVFAPVIVNKLGVKNTLIIGTLGWSVYTAALYQNNRYGTEWFVIFGAVICGLSAGTYWASEGAIVLAYPEPHKRGKYLALWLFFKNSGQIVSGAINLATNAHNSKGGKVNYKTLISFIALQVAAIPLAFFISNPDKVQRQDRSEIPLSDQTSTKEQIRLLWKTCSSRKVGMLLPVFFSSWFYWGYASLHLTLYYSVRARALASFLSAICGVIATSLLGTFLDSRRFSLAFRARAGAVLVFTLFSGILVWAIVVQHQFTQHNPGKLDWTDKSGRFSKGFGMLIMLNASGNAVQNYLYWLISHLAVDLGETTRYAGLLRGVESWGQCCSFGMNSTHFNPTYTVVINIVFWAVSLPSSFLTIMKLGREEGYGAERAGQVEDIERERSIDEKTVEGEAASSKEREEEVV
ncbi:hypothetical protein NBRC10512_005501 [Rhodotorula toruloides]|uniref:RHTO0S22e00408g1_1 n=2 Tax=Rhodotorula toruloides TaxID=5286 RepID=A0A061BPI9_RHOTO|nr:Major Facilitator Superfamily protein [Rhodotorula toruloides NP11]EMS18877.1 Major Facilitator Superfamily protein [Rhodotorula toruloides NP11]CDR48973.1 RHTO0S22e00408g1_1 [Rhodotorula toruloides]